MIRKLFLGVLIATAFIGTLTHSAQAAENTDSDLDGLTDQQELTIYHTDPNYFDTDRDGFSDGDEVTHDYDPNSSSDVRLDRHIDVTIKTQTLSYGVGPYTISSFKIATGVRGKDTPKGSYTVLAKLDLNLYKGVGYNYPNIKYNLRFKYAPGASYYIHGAPWVKRFGVPQSHGCVNVSYANMEPLYNWAQVGTLVTIK